VLEQAVIDLDYRDSALVATLDRGSQNTIDDRLADAIEYALAEAQRSGAFVLHLRSATPNFCGGADPERLAVWVGDNGREALLADSARWARLFEHIEAVPTIVLAEMRGNALGAGLGLALACDLRIAARTARIGVPEVRVGVLPAGMTIRRLVELGGTVTAQRMLLAGELVDGKEAYRLGLVHWVAEHEELDAQAQAIAQRLIKQSRDALRHAKALLASSRRDHASETFATENLAFDALLAGTDTRKRLQALLVRLAAASGT
jgi:enoyl-CoA hydratase/carnithine racemase